ncbi:uncharacterized protein LOC123501741 [Portunus trituberculatus]|uniref:uncharacterized protein LOC123501741 n=1 Tax=Portunus trituberculatus TaxID=210409 RepID=UPI001E1D1ED8|nr:uncharacterized protein LOC123501741 [Portunus trituberculatus]
MRRKGASEKYVRVIQDMYEGSRTRVRSSVGATEEFCVRVGLHQGSSLSPYLFNLLMDDSIQNIKEEAPWTMLFADDIVLVDESRDGVERKLERWRRALEERADGNLDGEIIHRIQSGWKNWKRTTGVLCDRKISARSGWIVLREGGSTKTTFSPHSRVDKKLATEMEVRRLKAVEAEKVLAHDLEKMRVEATIPRPPSRGGEGEVTAESQIVRSLKLIPDFDESRVTE